MSKPSKEALDAAKKFIERPSQRFQWHRYEEEADLAVAFDAFAASRAEQVRAGIVAHLHSREWGGGAYFNGRRDECADIIRAIESHEDERPSAEETRDWLKQRAAEIVAESQRPAESPAKCKRCGGAGSFIDGPFEDDLNNWVNCPECGGVGRSGKGAG